MVEAARRGMREGLIPHMYLRQSGFMGGWVRQGDYVGGNSGVICRSPTASHLPPSQRFGIDIYEGRKDTLSVIQGYSGGRVIPQL